jgi:phosphatidate cytidylyltransferase
MSNLTQRVLTAIVGVPLLYFIFYLGGIPFLILILMVIFLGGLESFKLLETKGVSSEKELGLISSLILGLSAYFGYFYLSVFFTIVIIFVLIFQIRKQDLSNFITGISATLFEIVYLGWFLSHAILLRNVDHNSNIKNYAETVQGLKHPGFFYVFFVVSCMFLNDTGAYFVGRWRGKRKLIPRISPGKTVEGTIGGIVSSIFTGEAVNIIFKSPLEFYWAFLFGFIIGVIGVLGDLVESLIKRDAGIKDSGGILPGHGGILDRFDSLILAFPVSYYFVIAYYWLNGISLGR